MVETAEVSYLSLFVYVFKLHRFSSYFQEVHQLAHANYVSTGQTVKSRPVVAIELQDFIKANAWKAGAVVESVKI